jgi:signal transduction histidine kinase
MRRRLRQSASWLQPCSKTLAREKLQEVDVLKSEYIALATHELRNPLSNIYGISSR